MDEGVMRLAEDGAEGGGGLTRADWIGAARGLLIAEGIDAVKVTRLAGRLGVTRGGFYWHFADRADLLDALLDLWTGQNTRAVIDAADSALDLAGGILALFDVWVDAARFDPAFDAAMRDWARRSPKVRKAVEAADTARVEAIAELFARSGYDADDAFIRARIIYFTQVGYYALHIHETMTRRLGYLERYYESFTGRRLAPEVAAAHRARHLRREKRHAVTGKKNASHGASGRKGAPRGRRGTRR
jgi:AcrR family transcriptional regulator